jgi:hypothetical protein
LAGFSAAHRNRQSGGGCQPIGAGGEVGKAFGVSPSTTATHSKTQKRALMRPFILLLVYLDLLFNKKINSLKLLN